MRIRVTFEMDVPVNPDKISEELVDLWKPFANNPEDEACKAGAAWDIEFCLNHEFNGITAKYENFAAKVTSIEVI